MFYLGKQIKDCELVLGIRLGGNAAPTYPNRDMKPQTFDPLKMFQFN